MIIEDLTKVLIFDSDRFIPRGLDAREAATLYDYFDETNKSVNVAKLLQVFLVALFGRIDPEVSIREINKNSQGLGVCAKQIGPGEYVWKCRDCQLDENAIQCGDCFANSNHEGHAVQYFMGGGGCCDCGDFGYFSEAGSCRNHKGFEASRDAMLNALPPDIKKNGLALFRVLAKALKKLMLLFEVDEDQRDMFLICDIVQFLTRHCRELKSSIYFVAEAFIEIPLIPI